MSTIGIVQIHDVITKHKDNYCCICYRSAVDRKLVVPVHFKSFLSKLANAGGFRGKLRVCYICEGLAMSAVRFIRAVELASRVSELFSNMEAGQMRDIVKYLSPPHILPEDKSGCSVALGLERSLQTTPRYDLRRTDTLVVSSPRIPRHGKMVTMQHDPKTSAVIPPLTSVIPSVAPRAPMAHTHVIAPPTPVTAPPTPVTAPPTPVMAPPTPVTASGNPRSVQPEVAVDPNLNIVKVYNKESNQIILHPMVTGLDGNIYVPSLQVQVLDNGILRSAPNIDNLIPPPSLTPAQNDSKLKKLLTNGNTNRKNDVKNKEQNDYYNFLASQKEQKESQNANVEIIKMNDLNIVLKGDGTSRKRKRDGSTEKTLSDVQLLLNENVNGGCEIKYEIIDDDDVKETQPPAKKGPVEKTDRTVDWEDKIPMDVISFMDATDPNPQERIMQPPPMGFISDVRSLPRENIEFIDLC